MRVSIEFGPAANACRKMIEVHTCAVYVRPCAHVQSEALHTRAMHGRMDSHCGMVRERMKDKFEDKTAAR